MREGSRRRGRKEGEKGRARKGLRLLLCSSALSLRHCSSRLGKNICRSFGALVAAVSVPAPRHGPSHQIQYRTDRPGRGLPRCRARAAASFGLVTFYCPWDTKVLGLGFSGHGVLEPMVLIETKCIATLALCIVPGNLKNVHVRV